MQTEIDAMGLAVEVQILGVNESGYENGNVTACEGKDLPWLQETQDQMVWVTWKVNYRDVIIVDEDNEPLATYNLTDHDLGTTADYDELKAMLVNYAGGP